MRGQQKSIYECKLNEALEPYKYKDKVEIQALGFVDDIIIVSESGHKTARIISFKNIVSESGHKTARIISFINAQLAMKKLRLGAKKCFVMHVGKSMKTIKI